MITPDKSSVQFVRLNRHMDGIEPDITKNIIFMRATEIATIHWDDQKNCTVVNVKGVDAPISVIQTPDEMLALMKDENASVLGNTTAQLIIKTDEEGNVITTTGATSAGKAA